MDGNYRQNQNWQNRNQNAYYNGYHNGQPNNGQPNNGYQNMNGSPIPNVPNRRYVNNGIDRYNNNVPYTGYNNYVRYGYAGPIITSNTIHPKTGGLAVGSLVCGIISIVGFWSFITLILAIVGAILGIVNIAQDNPNKGTAIAGIILNTVGLLLTIFFIMILMQV